jgi:hypothetical protein
MTKELETTPVYFHDCPALGKNIKLPRALLADDKGEYILYYHHKCLFCSETGGEREYATGVTPTADGYLIDTKIAEKLHN